MKKIKIVAGIAATLALALTASGCSGGSASTGSAGGGTAGAGGSLYVLSGTGADAGAREMGGPPIELCGGG